MRTRTLFFIAGLVAGTGSLAQAKEKQPDLPMACPIDGTLRTADPKLLERFSALADCSEQLLVAPATPSDYIEPDGAVIIDRRANSRADMTDDDEEYGLEYAKGKTTILSDDSIAALDAKPRNKSKAKNRNAAVGAKTEYQAYSTGSTSPSLSGTGIVVRIVPEAQPLPPASFAANTSFGGEAGQTPLGANDLSILSMRPQSFRTRYDDLIGNISNTHRIDPLFLHAVIYQESRYRPSAVSHAGATGLMQIMPGTGRMLGVHPSRLTDPLSNVDAGARLLRKLYYKYNGNFELVLAAYNAGEGAVAKYGNSIPPYRETQNYVKQVMARYSVLLAEQNAMVAPQ